MKMIDDPKFGMASLLDLAGDPRTVPMLRHYRQQAVTERLTCDPIEVPAYDGLMARFDAALVGGA